MIVADYFAIDQLLLKEFVAKDEKDAAMIAFNAGVEFEFPKDHYYKYLIELLNEGKVN